MNLLQRSLDCQLSMLEETAARLGYGGTGSIPEAMGFLEWCEDLAAKGLKIDGRPFRLDNRPALRPIYDAIPTTRQQAYGKTLVIQKATQLGLTVWEVLADLYMAKKWSPVNIGMFLPDQNTAAFKSERRFMPIIRSSPQLLSELIYRYDGKGGRQKIGEGNVLTREIAGSLLMFLWTSGKVSTESRPMDIVSLDEVQGMSLEEIDKVAARMGDSDVRFKMLLSTANMPDEDINNWYKRGTQEVWHTRCPGCGALSDLSDPNGIFPSRSIVFNKGQVRLAPPYPGETAQHAPPVDDYVWVCPECQGYIPDPQYGDYIAQNPGAGNDIRSFLLPRTISPRMTAREMFTDFGFAATGAQKQSFFNRTLARPYVDPDQIPVSYEVCQVAVERGRAAGVTWEATGSGTYMGIDQMGGFNAVIIKKRLPDNRQAVIHVEAVFDLSPFDRCADLMRQYGVEVCVVEQLPNFNDARKFANRFPGRVFLCTGYQDMGDESMHWGDSLSRSERMTSEEERTRYTVRLDRYKCMQTSLYRIRDGICLFPDPNGLEQEVIENGRKRRIAILYDWVFLHFSRTALVTVADPETGKTRRTVQKIGLDPHFSFALMLCDAAWARVQGNSTFILPDAGLAGVGAAQSPSPSAAQNLTSRLAEMMGSAPEGACGKCRYFGGGTCSERDLRVGALDPGCVFYEPAADDVTS